MRIPADPFAWRVISGGRKARRAGKVVNQLSEVLPIVPCRTMAGAKDFCEFERRARQKLDFLRHLPPFEKDAPTT